MGVSENGGTQQPWVFLLKMTILGCFGGTPILGNPQIKIMNIKKSTSATMLDVTALQVVPKKDMYIYIYCIYVYMLDGKICTMVEIM